MLFGLLALVALFLGCRDDVPSVRQQTSAIAQQQENQLPAEVDDSLCALLDPLINRRSITEPRVNHRDVVDAIEQGTTINARCKDGVSPLHHAAASHSVEVVVLLLERGADVHAANNAGETPLIYAVGRTGGIDSDVPALEVLLSAGADINATKEFGQTALHVAALAGKSDALAALLEHEPDLAAVDNGGRTALHYAAFQTATVEPTRLLLANGLDPSATATDGTTPLHFAATNGGAEVSRLLLEAGANPNPINGDGMSPLHYAAPEGGAALIRVLLEHGADPNIPDPDRRTALHLAARQNPLSVVSELLLDAGANPSAQDRHGNTPCDLLSGNLSDPEVRQRICDVN